MAETLEEYLVKLGWDIDEMSFSKALGMISRVEGGSAKMVGSLVSNTAKGAAALASVFLALELGVAKTISKVADADLEVERFARKMWTTETKARSFTTALSAMGASYNDIFYMTPEEYNSFMTLNNLGQQLEAPKALQDDLRLVRDIQFEFSKMKMEANYATQWVAYYFIEHFKIPMQEGKTALESLNDYIMKNMPQIAKKVSHFLIEIVDAGTMVVRVIKLVGSVLTNVVELFPPGMLKIAAAIAAITALIMANPLIAFLVGLFMVLEDLAVWQKGGKAALGGIWEMFAEIGRGTDTSGLDDIRQALDNVWGSANNLIKKLGDLIRKIIEFGDESGTFKAVWEAIAGLFDLVAASLKSITEDLEKLSEINSFSKLKDFFNRVTDVNTGSATAMALQGTGIGPLLSLARDFYGETKSSTGKQTGTPLSGIVLGNKNLSFLTDRQKDMVNNTTSSTIDSNNTTSIEVNVYEAQNAQESASEVGKIFKNRQLANPLLP